MPFEMHTVEVVDGSNQNRPDRLIVAVQSGVVNASGGAGVAITTAVTFANELPANYAVLVTPSQFCSVSVTSKTNTGFNVVLTPSPPSTASIAAGTFDVVVVA